RQLALETRAKLEERGDAAARRDLAVGGAKDAGDALEQRGLPGTVVAEQPDGRAVRHFEFDPAQRPEVLARYPSEVDHAFLQRRVALVGELEPFGDTADRDRRRHRAVQSSSAKSPSARPKTQSAKRKSAADATITMPRCQRYHH